MKTKISIAAVLAVAVLLLAGCQSSTALSGSQTPALTAEQAQKIALDHAGFSKDAVTELLVRSDVDDGKTHFDVDFRQGDYEYDYEIDAVTGKILSREKDYDPRPVATDPAPTDPAPTVPEITDKPVTDPAPTDAPTTDSPDNKTISKEEAEKIALNHAGLKASEVTRLRVELEKDNGRTYYEVDFRKGNYEYDYKIHSTTGKIVEWDKDFDD